MAKRTALILGGTSGVGLATARQLHAPGTKVHVGGRNTRRLDEVATTDPTLSGHRVDANDAKAVQALASQIGPIDYLITTVGGSDGSGPIADLDLTMLRRAFDAKFWGHITSIQ